MCQNDDVKPLPEFFYCKLLKNPRNPFRTLAIPFSRTDGTEKSRHLFGNSRAGFSDDPISQGVLWNPTEDLVKPVPSVDDLILDTKARKTHSAGS